MNYKKFLIIISILFIIGIPLHAGENKYIPETTIYIQPLDEEHYNINNYKTLKIGQEYQLQILAYIKKRGVYTLADDSVTTAISLKNPLIDIVDYPHNVHLEEYNTGSIAFFLSAPIFRTAPKDDMTDMLQIDITFIPRKPGKQELFLFYDENYIDKKYEKKYTIKIE